MCRNDRLNSSASEIPKRAASALAARYSRSLKLICVRIMITILVELLSQRKTRTQISLSEREYRADRKSTRLNSSHSQISYAVFCLKKKKVTPLVCHVALT